MGNTGLNFAAYIKKSNCEISDSFLTAPFITFEKKAVYFHSHCTSNSALPSYQANSVKKKK
ncbi:hypothetical protein M670_01406 [Schinkia azotoformans MEV2011]|uniref:Uncharacterized protein n=1 Tax=Schinkia azotoformans MEV2011 TaxID=1348973 RepID=A0A072P0J1_SCHAZ|nr:hypothetical protein M670_01406 [Schinkia azotoformans MEV2011]